MTGQKNTPAETGACGLPRRGLAGGGYINTIEQLFDILTFIDCTDRETWLKAGMAIKQEFGEAGRDYWLEWSMAAPNYNFHDALTVWKSFKGGKVSFATLIFLAKQGGWRPDPDAPRPSREEIEERNRRAQEALERAEIQRAQEHGRVVIQAREKLESAFPETGTHAYLVKKGVGPRGILTTGYSLLIPMRDIDGKLWSWQEIDPDGKKRFPKGGRVTGLFHRIGKPMDNTLVICEGYATGATLHEETGHAVAVAFNAGNLKPVAQALRKKYPHFTLIIAADNDRFTKGNPGLAKANEAALAVGGRVAVPEFPKGTQGTDFNDLAQIGEVSL